MNKSSVHYVTVFDSDYALRAATLARSLLGTGSKNITLYYTGSDYHSFLESFCWPRIKLRTLQDLYINEHSFVRLRDRANAEFHWALKPFVVSDVMGSAQEGDWVFYLDSDTFSFSSFEEIISRLPSSSSVYGCPHYPRDHFYASHIQKVGEFNAGVIGFKVCQDGKSALQWWMDRCIESTSSSPSDSCYADQKYLNAMRDKFDGFYQNESIGINAAPWNVSEVTLQPDGTRMTPEQEKIYLYHMQAFRCHSARFSWLYTGKCVIDRSLRSIIYLPYISAINETRALLKLSGAELPYDQLTAKDLLRYLHRLVNGYSNILLT